MPHTPSPRVIGQKLAEARKARSIKQDDAAAHISVSRPTFIAIEKGERAAKPNEIIKLAELYGRSVNHFVRSSELLPDFQTHFRAAVEKSKPADAERLREAINEFREFVENYVDLERRMKTPLQLNYPAPLELNRHVNVTALAEDVANRERLRLGLGDHYIPDIRDFLESEVGVRIVNSRLPAAVASLYIFVDGLGACVSINRDHPIARRRVSLAHAYAHLIVDRFTARIDFLSLLGRKSAIERFAESFAMSFLMPASSVRLRFNEIVTTTGDFQIGDLVKLKHRYFVSMEAMSHRLESLGLLKPGTWEIQRDKSSSMAEAKRHISLTTKAESEPAYPDRYRLLIVHAHERGELSEKEVANFLQCDIWEARRMIQESLLSVEIDSDGQAREIQTDLEVSLLSAPS